MAAANDKMLYPIGHDFHYSRPGSGPVWRCVSRDRSGYWLEDLDDPQQRVNVSERAIDRTIHHARGWRCSACSQNEEGHRRHSALAAVLGAPMWTRDLAEDAEKPWLRVTCYPAGATQAIAVDYLHDGDDNAFDLYLAVTPSSSTAQEKVGALRAAVRMHAGTAADVLDACAAFVRHMAGTEHVSEETRYVLERCAQMLPETVPDAMARRGPSMSEAARHASGLAEDPRQEVAWLREFLAETGHTREEFLAWLERRLSS